MLTFSLNLTCPVCWEAFGGSKAFVPVAGLCLHNICQRCFDQLGEKNCPICRESIHSVKINHPLIEFLSDREKKIDELRATSLSEISAKARDFVNKESYSQLNPTNRITHEELDLLWVDNRELSKSVFDNIQLILSEFHTHAETLALKVQYNQLCDLGARLTAVKDNNATAQYCLGHCLFYGIRQPENRVEAMKYYKLAADQGLPLAVHKIAQELEISDPRQAFQKYRIAANRRCPEAVTRLGFCYLKGIGVPRSIDNGIKILETAASYGNMDAMVMLADFHSTVDTKDESELEHHREQATDYYLSAIDCGYEEGKESLEKCLEKGASSSNETAGCTML